MTDTRTSLWSVCMWSVRFCCTLNLRYLVLRVLPHIVKYSLLTKGVSFNSLEAVLVKQSVKSSISETIFLASVSLTV